MKKFLLTYHAPFAELMEASKNAKPEDRAVFMKQWEQWAERCGEHLVDLGAPLGMSQTIKTDGSTHEGTESLSGYSILQAEDMEQAMRLVQGHPHISWGQA